MADTNLDIEIELEALQNEVLEAKKRLLEARKRRPRELVEDYVLKGADDKDARLSELFGDKDDLIVIHNMGARCRYCTLWADGFMGLLPHLEDRAAFVVCSPDTPEAQKRFADKRNWKFKMVSAHESPFIKEMGFWQDSGDHPGAWPGLSTFRRDPDGKIYRIAKSHFGPGDDFCAIWPMQEMLQDGINDWDPQYSYEKSG